ncbi:MAG: dynamin family protein [Muribaculaceae bacterium]|nr:dynamin family protein [Muribaculaceae bacterium]
MDLILVIVIAVLALAIGACVAFLISKRTINNSSSGILEESENLKNENASLVQKLQVSEKEAETLNNKISSLQNSVTSYSAELEEAKRGLQKLTSQLQDKESQFEATLGDLQTQLALTAKDGEGNPEALQRFKNLQEEVEKYKKKISSLENEIEDLNEEVEDAEDKAKKFQRRLEEKTQECRNLEISIKEFSIKNEELSHELSQKSQELIDKVKELGLKITSLDFVREILTAGVFDDTNFIELEQKVNTLAEFVENDLRLQQAKLTKSGIRGLADTLMKGIDESSVERWAVYQKKTWIQGKKAIAFVGEFSAGKTSIVNRILQDNDKNATGLPVSAKATTAIPTYISGGPKLTFSFISPSNVRKKITEETFKQVNKEVLDQIEGISALIKYFVMTYRNPALDKISILDTPGFNSNDAEDAQRTSEVINECDALFWVMDVNAGEINNSSRSVIKKYLNIPLFIVINKTDTKAPSEVEKAKQKIANTLANDGIKVEDFILFGHNVPISAILSIISNKVIHKGDQDNFIRIVRDNMKKVYETLKHETTLANNSKNKCLQEADQLQYEFENNCRQLQYLAERVAEIGQKKETWLGFGKDVWQMSIEEKQELDSLCQNQLQDYVNNLYQISNLQKSNAKNSQSSSTQYADMKAAAQEFTELSQKFIKYAKDFQNLNREN